MNSQDITTEGVDKGTILFNSLNMLYEHNPESYTFQAESAQGSSDEALVDLTSCQSCKDSDGETWYEVTLPFDNKGLWHYLSLLNGVNRTAQQKGWVKASDTKLTSALNWPEFKLAQEEGTGNQDARIDYQNLTPFFKELFEDIDISGNGAISAREIKAALKDSVLADRLSRVIAKHPSEWQSDDTCSKWAHLKELVPDDAAFEEAKKQITNLAWWDKAKDAGADLPASSEVYHIHPVSFIEQLHKTNSIEYSEEFKLLIATIYGEAAGSSEAAWKSITCVIMNRIGVREWKRHKTVSDIITKTGFDAYSHNTPLFKSALALLNKKDSKADEKIIKKIANTILGFYMKEESDITNNAVLYYSPNAQAVLHKSKPSIYQEKPPWDFSIIKEVIVSGLSNDDDFKFFKYK